jgi:predicted DNA-binding transcriptional regulator AlpA
MTSADRDKPPSYEERARRIPDLLELPAMPVAEVALFLDLPLSTLDKLRAEGSGPKCFRLGRRLYVLQSELREWLKRMAVEEAV